MLALGLVGNPLDRGGFEGGEFDVLLVLPGDRPVLVNLFSDVESEINFDRKKL